MNDLKVLLVEDETIAAMDIKRSLESFGYQVPYVASSGEEAIEKALEILPDLIIMDIIFKGEKDGIEAALELKNLNIPIIYLTAHSEDLTIERAKLTEPYAYINKPFGKSELKLAVEIALYKKNMERKLEESEKSYRELVENSMVAIYKTNMNGDILFANPAMAEMFGFESVEEFKTIKAQQLYKNLKDRKPIIEKLIKYGKLNHQQVDLISNTGETITILLSANLKDNIISGMMMDITPRIKSEKKLENSVSRFRALVECTLDGIITTDVHGNILHFNNSLQKMFGYSKDELHNSKLTLLMPEKYHKKFMDSLRHFRSTGEHKLTERTTETIGLKKNGTEFPFEMSLAKWEIGEKIYFSAIIRDITERKRAQEKLLNKEKELSSIYNNVADVIFVLAVEGKNIYRFISANPAFFETTGLTESQVVGKYVHEVIPEPSLTLVLSKYNEAIQEKKTVRWEEVTEYPAGIKWGSVSITPIFNGNTHCIKMIGSVHDITQLKCSLEEKEVLLKEIHHRVKNNMQIISSLLNLQKSYVTNNETAVDVLKESQNRVKSMAMIHEKLYLSTDLTQIDFENYIKSLVLDLFHTYAICKEQINITITVKDIMLNIETALPCGLIINELVSNSLKYAFPQGREGELKLSLKKFDDNYELIISDNGIGFPENLNYKKTNSLGLQLVNNLVSQIEGTISMNTNHGTEFKIIFKELNYQERM
ncbi:PAS domain S-box protein [uncultured Methanobacterium sp.]|uniref:PAS domain S-box protein n=1 Tax=uncultured Methanobacterium sp. TaxID=176306 RepID=UPI002AA7E59A|nr:PAS domain S-box protein [uncultured Methanobacterium sp.]